MLVLAAAAATTAAALELAPLPTPATTAIFPQQPRQPPTRFVQLGGSPLIQMPSLNLGTCCGSRPAIGVPAWIHAGGRGIDTAYDYQDEVNISTALRQVRPDIPRGELFILSKVRAAINGQEMDPPPSPRVTRAGLAGGPRRLGTAVQTLLPHRRSPLRRALPGRRRGRAITGAGKSARAQHQLPGCSAAALALWTLSG
eukprot:COSAG01_NODE_7212_length_3303_cov_3.954432_4_plen_199_part_00